MAQLEAWKNYHHCCNKRRGGGKRDVFMNISNERLEKSEDVLSFVLQIVGSAFIFGAIGTSLIAYGEELEKCRS
jgi:hypothetical protein